MKLSGGGCKVSKLNDTACSFMQLLNPTQIEAMHMSEKGLPTTPNTFQDFNYFGHMIYAQQTSIYYKNIAKLLALSSIMIWLVGFTAHQPL